MTVQYVKCLGCGKTFNVNSAEWFLHNFYCPFCGIKMVEERKMVLRVEQ